MCCIDNSSFGIWGLKLAILKMRRGNGATLNFLGTAEQDAVRYFADHLL
jgi:hypothetical protein